MKREKIAILGGGMASMTAALELTKTRALRERFEVTVYQDGWLLGGKGASVRNRDAHHRIEEHGLHLFMGFYQNAFGVVRDVYRELQRSPGTPLATWEEAFTPYDNVMIHEQHKGEWQQWPFHAPRNNETPGDGQEFLPAIEYANRGLSLIAYHLKELLREAKKQGTGNREQGTEAEGERTVRGAGTSEHLGPPSPRPFVDTRFPSVSPVSASSSAGIQRDNSPATPSSSSVSPRLDRGIQRDDSSVSTSWILRPQQGALHRGMTGKTGTIARLQKLLSLFASLSTGLSFTTFSITASLIKTLFRRQESLEKNLSAAIKTGQRWMASWADDPLLRRAWISTEFVAINVLGILREGLGGKDADFTKLDHLEYREWLRGLGASEMVVNSSIVRAFYNLVFANTDGGGAGTCLLGSIRMFFGYKGAIMYRMNAGMGETIFAPMYEVLRRRGVRFEFFQRVHKLSLSSDQRSIHSIEVGRQASVRSGRGTELTNEQSKQKQYNPLINVDGLPCWPEAPLVEQLNEREQIEARLKDGLEPFTPENEIERYQLIAGEDFDRVILGISIGALHGMTQELSNASTAWREMLQHVKTVKTTAMQLWFDKSTTDLGWSSPAIMGTYEYPFETCTDMSHLLKFEKWGDKGPKSLMYFCGNIDDGNAPYFDTEEERCEARQINWKMSKEWLSKYSHPLWPNVSDPNTGSLRWEELHDPQDFQGSKRLAAQYIRVNTQPSERYVLSVAGSTKYRLRTDETGFSNLLITGDWIKTGFDFGCIEAATMSGLQAARAATGGDIKVLGEGSGARPVKPGKYIERFDDMVMRSPYYMKGTQLSAFLFRSDYQRLAAILERHLNQPSGGKLRYIPAAPYVSLMAAFAAKAGSCDAEHSQRAFMPESDVAFWIPCLTMHELVPRLVWFLPYVFVDSLAATIAGREVYGFSKTLVEIDKQGQGKSLTSLALKGHVIPRFSAESPVVKSTLFQLRRSEFEGSYEDLKNLSWLSPVLSVAKPGASIVFLKQFRDINDPRMACYQAITEASATTDSLRSFGLFDSQMEATWSHFDSHPFVEFGLSSRSSIGFWADFDFTMQNGREVFRVV